MRAALVVAILAGSTTASASLDRELIRREMKQAEPAVARCIAVHALPEGRYSFTITVGSSGGVLDVKLEQAPDRVTPAGAQCLTAAYRRVRFKPFKWGASFVIGWPITVAPQKSVERDAAGRRR